jgi:hypothetical protein
MPNHCYNVLSLKDNPLDLKKVIKKFMSKKDGETFLDFDKIIKMPKELQIDSMKADTKTDEGKALKKAQDSNMKKFGFKDWYDWCNANWGTKWNSYDCQLGDETVSFQTAWAPPLPVITELAEKTGKDWILRYSEQGMDFCGEFTAYKTGMEDHQEYSSHKDAPEELLEELGVSKEDLWSEEELINEEIKLEVKKVIKKKKDEEIDDNLEL